MHRRFRTSAMSCTSTRKARTTIRRRTPSARDGHRMYRGRYCRGRLVGDHADRRCHHRADQLYGTLDSSRRIGVPEPEVSGLCDVGHVPETAVSAVLLPNERNGTVNVSSRRRGAEGQIIVIFALALVAIVAMVGLVIDGGTLFAQQRVAQNGADSAATAGTLIIAENLGAATDIRKEQDVYLAVTQIATKNGLAGLAAEYTDDLGIPSASMSPLTRRRRCPSLPRLAVCERPDHAASARPLPASSGSTS